MSQRKITQPADDTTKPDVDEKEPLTEKSPTDENVADDDENADETEKASEPASGTDAAKVENGPGVKQTKVSKPSTRKAVKPKGDAAAEMDDRAGEDAEPDVDSGGGDGATGVPAVGTSRDAIARGLYSTKEGDAPIGVERDVGAPYHNPAGPDNVAHAQLSARLPAGTVAMRQPVSDVTEKVTEVIREFSPNGTANRETLTGGLNLHDDLGIQRAHNIHFAAKLEEAFGIDITPSEAQNILLVRDAVNTVLRKLARK
jgi:acyl carrier protein